MMLWVLAFHVIFMVAWFAGLFYLPRLYVYHATTFDQISLDRFKKMERRLYYGIMMPAGILTTVFGFWALLLNMGFYWQQLWMHAKLVLVVLLWMYHLYCGYLLKQFKYDRNRYSSTFYRWFNEVPTVLLIIIVILAVVKP